MIIPLACVITSIDYDHVDVLGHSLDDIARAKAGIIKKGIPVVLGPRACLRPILEMAQNQAAIVNKAYGFFDDENIPDENTANIVKERIIESLSECLLAEKQKFAINTNINVYLDEDGYDELESACYTEIETIYPLKKDIKVKNTYEHILAK